MPVIPVSNSSGFPNSEPQSVNSVERWCNTRGFEEQRKSGGVLSGDSQKDERAVKDSQKIDIADLKK